MARWDVKFVRLMIQADREPNDYARLWMEDGRSFNEAAFKDLKRLSDMMNQRDLKLTIAASILPGRTGGI